MAKQPNVVVLMSDQQRLDTVSCYGLNEVWPDTAHRRLGGARRAL